MEDKQQLNKVIKRGMNADHSWGAGLPRIYRNVPTINQQK
jgi:hypothetical protein